MCGVWRLCTGQCCHQSTSEGLWGVGCGVCVGCGGCLGCSVRSMDSSIAPGIVFCARLTVLPDLSWFYSRYLSLPKVTYTHCQNRVKYRRICLKNTQNNMKAINNFQIRSNIKGNDPKLVIFAIAFSYMEAQRSAIKIKNFVTIL